MIVARPCHFEAPGETRACLRLPSHAVNKQSNPRSKMLWVSGWSRG